MGRMGHGCATIEPLRAPLVRATMARACRQSSNTAIRWPAGDCLHSPGGAGFDRGVEPGAREQGGSENDPGDRFADERPKQWRSGGSGRRSRTVRPDQGSLAQPFSARMTESWNATGSRDTPKAMVVAFRRHTPLPRDDCLHALQPTIPHPLPGGRLPAIAGRRTRSSLHGCLRRHGISRLPDMDGDKPGRQRFKRDPIGDCHIE